MSGFVSRAAFGLAAIGMALPANAQQPPAPKIVWNLGWQDNQCTLTTGTDALGLSLWLLPGNPAPDLYVGGVQKLVPPQSDKAGTVKLLPSGETFQGKFDKRAQGFVRPMLSISQLGDDFLAAFAKADAIQLVTQKGSVSIPVKGAGKAVAALNECRDLRLQEWGIDPKAFAAVRTDRGTTPEGGGFITGYDYPKEALDNYESGTVVARLNIDTQGRVKDCAVVVSSRSRSLDVTTCAILVQRARYTPAIGQDGRPTPFFRVTKIDWWISGLRPRPRL